MKLIPIAVLTLLIAGCPSGYNPGPVPAPVITDFAQLVSCIVQNIGSLPALLLNCGQWTFAEIEAAIAWLEANPKAQTAYGLTLPQLQSMHASMRARMAADGGAR